MSPWHAATVVAARQLTATSRILVLAVPGFTGARPGQHVDVRLTAPDGYQASRSYSLAATGTDERVELAVAAVPDGEVSPYLVEVARPGDAMEVRGPLGGWFVWDPADPAPVLLVAGGSGVVPLVAMLRARADAGVGTPFRLVLSVRTAADVLFADELAVPDDGVLVHRVVTRADDGDRPAGRLTADDLLAPGFGPDDAPGVFVCGPTGFVEHAATLLTGLGHRAARVRTERFGGTS
ncbi:ferredoxin-NADP reductase [Isoptericola jiangsuensis]|uniref:Ferredoxin-NADP reductase n=1 Tax=Isoptericola jiangsuensis TaxID=548579 RepID=A0A2A9EXT4_9MICO|nr:FAD-binding oxidoreductase [Isoptericola jiangsuensis]PFG42979.1 ferredoxin-NADP reductase [Isoptericola jiangsuensis]